MRMNLRASQALCDNWSVTILHCTMSSIGCKARRNEHWAIVLELHRVELALVKHSSKGSRMMNN
jgi:hypothetical protein